MKICYLRRPVIAAMLVRLFRRTFYKLREVTNVPFTTG